MIIAWTICWIFLTISLAMHTHKIVRIPTDPRPIMIIDKSYKPIPDNETLEFLGHMFNDLQIIPMDSTIPLSAPVESMKRQNWTPDENMRVFTVKFKTIQDNPNLIRSITVIPHVWNPSVNIWNERLLMFFRYPRAQVIYKTWLHTNFSIDDSMSKFGIGPGPKKAFSDDEQQRPQSDARVVVRNSTNLWSSYFSASDYLGRIRSVEMKIDDTNNNLTVTSDELALPIFYHGVGSTVHKNWTPFIFNDEEYFIETIHPLRVVRNNAPNQREVSFVSSTEPPFPPTWSYGDLRGGTPAKYIGSNRYLAFFHSRTVLPGGQRITYFMGAYIFTAEPPFRLMAMSREPIYRGGMYDGPWGELKACDYVYFPMSFYFNDGSVDRLPEECDHKCMHGYNITLSMGAQDREGWIVTMNLLELFHTLRPLTEPSQLGSKGVGAMAETHAEGGRGGSDGGGTTVLLDEVVVCDGQMFTIYDKQRHAVRDAGLLNAYHYAESKYKSVTRAELASYPLGLPLVRYNQHSPAVMTLGSGDIFVVKDGFLSHVPDYDSFLKGGYLPPGSLAYNMLTTSELEAIPLASG